MDKGIFKESDNKALQKKVREKVDNGWTDFEDESIPIKDAKEVIPFLFKQVMTTLQEPLIEQNVVNLIRFIESKLI